MPDEPPRYYPGERVAFTIRNHRTISGGEGTVLFQWWAEDEVATKIETDDGIVINAIPGIGDTITRLAGEFT
jgi:hypothetical protein